MNAFFGFLFIVAAGGLLWGLVRPSSFHWALGNRSHRKGVGVLFGSLLIVATIGASATASQQPNTISAANTGKVKDASTVATPSPKQHATATPTPTPTPTPKPSPKPTPKAIPIKTPRATPTPFPPPAATPKGCTPLSNEGTCYKAGEYCRDSDHGATGIAADGEGIACEDNNGWRWEPN